MNRVILLASLQTEQAHHANNPRPIHALPHGIAHDELQAGLALTVVMMAVKTKVFVAEYVVEVVVHTPCDRDS